MSARDVSNTRLAIDWTTGAISGPAVSEIVRTLGQLPGLFLDGAAYRRSDPETVIYRVQSYTPVPEGTEGGLYWGTTTIEAGRIGEEYFMTKGHSHRKRNRAEYYATIQGEGALLLMDEDRNTWYEAMTPGSLHYIPANTAHRTANTGRAPLVFTACWPSDAGHDYHSIEEHGFGARLLDRDGAPCLVPQA